MTAERIRERGLDMEPGPRTYQFTAYSAEDMLRWLEERKDAPLVSVVDVRTGEDVTQKPH